MIRRLAATVIAAAIVLPSTSQAQTASPGCIAVTSASVTAAQDEITALRNNVRKPQSVTALTCLTALTSISTLSADLAVQSFKDQILTQIVSQVCNALNSYWQTVLNELKCGISVSGIGVGFPNIGGGTICQLNLNVGGGYGEAINVGAGIGPDGGGYYINGGVADVAPYGR